jgi:ribonucleoside-diphosphate reductase alpha chain
VKDVFRTSHDISPEWHVRMQAAVQKHVDNSVSKTINFPHDATSADVAHAYMLAYELGCKGITVYRDGSKAGQVLSTGGSVQESAASGDVTAEGGGPHTHVTPRERPRTTQGVTERVRTGHGNMYVTVNFDEEDQPFEVFGTLGKSGGCDSAQLEAISRLVSLALRSGIDPQNVIEQLRGITCCPAWDSGTLVRSSPDAVALAMERSLITGEAEEAALHHNGVQMALLDRRPTKGPSTRLRGYSSARKCPDCNAQMIFQEGCLMCQSCGWNKCE